uniref:non-specific serine/threonine protein kinase n=1 Tax=Mola mola TaxID=94237 RepID=A0A3Q3VR66_MOLML
METRNCVAKLNEYAQRTRSALNYEDVGSAGPDHIKTFTLRVVLNGKAYPDGVGRNKKEAKQKAAENVLKALLKGPLDTAENTEEAPPSPVQQTVITQTNYVCWLNEYSHKYRVNIKAVESPKLGPSNQTQCCSFVVGDKHYPEATGKTKREAKEEAAKLVYQEICGSTTRETGVEKSISTNQPPELFNQNVSEICDKTKRLSAITAEEGFAETDFIGLINNYCQKKQLLHDYISDKKCGLANNSKFFYKLVINNKDYPVGEGWSVKEAKKNAAQLGWSALQEQSDWDSKVLHIQSPDAKPKIRQKFTHLYINSYVSFLPQRCFDLNRFTSEYDSIVCLGKGTFGRVFKAREILLMKDYAIKVVRCKEKALREVGALSDLNHCNIVRYYTCWLEDSGYQWESVANSCSSSQSTGDSPIKYLYIKMELCATKTLRVWIDEKNVLNVKKSLRDSKRREESLDIAKQIVSGVEYFHSRKLLHRDLKPANIMFGPDGKVKIGDFGLVTAENDDDAENMMERTMYKGTPSYMAPEQRSRNTYDRKVDIFALGLIYFELLWNISTGHEKNKIWEDIRNQKTPQGFVSNFQIENRIIKSMLCAKPEDRPEASKIQAELEECTHALSPKNSFCKSKTF